MNEPHHCLPDEKDQMIALVDLVMREGIDQTFETDYPLVYQDQNMENIFIIKADDKIASVVPVLPREVGVDNCHFNIGIISPTATSPEYRKRGYALKCVNACIEKITSEGAVLTVLWTEISTFRFYEHAKFQAVRSQDWVYSCMHKDTELFKDNGHTVIEYDAESQRYLQEMQEMHEREIVGILRKDQDYPFLFNLPKSKVLISIKNEQALGYLIVSDSINKPGLVEAGGDESAVGTLIFKVLNEIDDGVKLKVYANLTPTILGDIFEERLPDRRFSNTATGMMVRINNVFNFMSGIKYHLEKVSAGGTAESFSLEITDTSELVSFNFIESGLVLGRETLELNIKLTLQEFTSVVFGSHRERMFKVPPPLEPFFPLYFPIWQLDHS